MKPTLIMLSLLTWVIVLKRLLEEVGIYLSIRIRSRIIVIIDIILSRLSQVVMDLLCMA